VTSDIIDLELKPLLLAPDTMFRRLVECAGQGIGWADLAGRIVYMNPSLRRMLDLAVDADIVGIDLRRFRTADAAPLSDEMLSVTREQGNWSGEMPLLSEQGRVIPTWHDIHLLRDEAGAPIAFGCVITDLSEQKRYEQRLRNSQSKYRTLVENIPQRVFYKDRQSRYLAVNQHYAKDKRLSPQEVVGQDDYAFNPRDLADKYRQDDRRVMASGQAEEYDEMLERDGRRITVHTIKTPVRDEDGEVIGICGIFSDVTEQRHLEARLQESEATLRTIYENAQEGIMVVSVESRRIVMVNPAICRMLGYSEAECLTITPFALHPPEVLPRVLERFLAMEQGDFSLHHEVPFLRKDGRIVYVDVSPACLSIQGKPCFLGVLRDVTDRRLVLAQLRDERNFSAAVLDNAGALMIVLDREGRISRFNRACEKISGYCFGEVEGRYPWDFLMLPEEREKVREHVLLALGNHPEELARKYTNYWLDKSGGKHLLEWHKAPLLDDKGRLEYLVSIGIDITEKQAVEDALRHSQETHAQAEAIANLGSWELDMATGVLHWTDEVFRIFGHPPQTFVATHEAFMAAVHPDDRQQIINALDASIADANTDYAVEHRVIRPDGEIRVVQERAKVYRDESGVPFRMIGSVHDITERKKAERELERYRNHLEVLVRERTAELGRQSNRNTMIMNTASDGFFTAGPEGRVVECNDIYCRMLGYSRDELLRLSIADIEAIETAEETAARCKMLEQQGNDRFDTRHRRKDGSLLDVEVSVTLAQIGDDRQYFVFVRDISTRKEAEATLIRARDEAERANQAKSEFLSRMSHELRTPLNAILGFGQLLERANLGGLHADNVREILHAGHHLLELINEVLDLARIESGKFAISLEPVPLLPLVADCVGLIRPLAENSGINLTEEAGGCDVYVLADQTRLKQVLLNLLSNAIKYNRPLGSASLVCKRLAAVFPGGAVEITVSDTGPGLSSEHQARLFTAFERLGADNTPIEGTGIGLALSKRLTELMGGEIGVASTPGHGTTFWLRLPLAQQRSGQEAYANVNPNALPEVASSQKFDLLCIEDNPANMRLIERILALRTDIRLIKASTPRQGLELAIARHPALILLDINLPEMDGFEVFQCLRENPVTRGIPVIGISANAMPKEIEGARVAGFAAYLTKPLDIGQFLAVVERNLGNCSEPGGR